MVQPNKIDLAYGRGVTPIRIDVGKADWGIIRPVHEPPLSDPHAEFVAACGAPTGSGPLGELVSSGDRVTIVTSDGTRAVPNRQLIPWILDTIPCADDQVTILLGTGTHRPNTPEEIEAMFGPDVVRRVRIVNHTAYDQETNTLVGTSACGTPVYLDRAYVEADKRIVVGFIEPHFFAGFSGGPKGVAPGVAGIDTIHRLHRAEIIGHPCSTWGVLDGNLLHEEVCEAVAVCPPDFLVNVTLNGQKEITGFYVGHHLKAHREGCDSVKRSSMAPVDEAFPLVITSNSGYPLDQNLYQAVKGISAAARITCDGGTILVASECSDGVPDHGKFAQLMRAGGTPDDIVQAVYDEEPVLDQWQAQVLANILKRVQVEVYSSLPPSDVRDCKMTPVDDLDGAVADRLANLGPGPRVAVMPDGPLTIPYVVEG